MEKFDVSRYEAALSRTPLGLGRPLHYSELTGSTNDDALQAAKAEAPHGATFVADHQTRGRGRRGRTWLDDAGANLLASVLLRTELPPESVSLLALAAGLSVRSALENAITAPAPDSACRVHIKWPNDVWLDRKKVAGILCESQVVSGHIRAVVVGFGVNVGTVTFPAELTDHATSLHRAGVVGYARETLLVDTLAALEARVAALQLSGARALTGELNRYDGLLGCKVSVDGTRGVAAGIDDRGRLKVQTAEGAIAALTVGTVELLPTDEPL